MGTIFTIKPITSEKFLPHLHFKATFTGTILTKFRYFANQAYIQDYMQQKKKIQHSNQMQILGKKVDVPNLFYAHTHKSKLAQEIMGPRD